MRVKRHSAARKTDVRRGRAKFVLIGQFQYPLVRGLMEIEGHKLNPSHVALFKHKCDERLQIAERRGDPYPSQEARRIGLSNLLWEYRPRVMARDRLLDLSMELQSVVAAIGQMRDYSFTGGITGDSAPGDAGCELLTKLIEETEKRLSKIKHFVTSMAMEPTTKLHDWTRREAQFQRLKEARS